MPGYTLISNAVPPPLLRQLVVESERLTSAEPEAAHGIRDLLHKSPVEFAPRSALAPGLAWYEGQPLSKLALWFDTEPHNATLNMAIDEALLEQATLPVLRIYRWAEPSISIGYGQKLDALAADLPPWPIVRRRTGGGAVWHGDDSTYSLIIPANEKWSNTRPIASYQQLHESLAQALNASDHGPCRLATSEDQRAGAACFKSPALHDIMRATTKLAGAGQRRTRHGLLHQGSLRIADLDDAFWQSFAHSLANEVIPWLSLPSHLQQRAAELAEQRVAL